MKTYSIILSLLLGIATWQLADFRNEANLEGGFFAFVFVLNIVAAIFNLIHLENK